MNRKLQLLVPLAAALAAAVLVAPTAASAGATACVPGKTTVGGKNAYRYCGPAKASATIGSKPFTFSGGTCQVAGQLFTVNIGTLLIKKVAGGKPGPSKYFGVTIASSDPGKYKNQTVTWNSGGKGYAILTTKVVLDKGVKSGSFTGRLLGGLKVKGSFTC